MSQRWYTYSGVFVPGTRARAEDVANEFTTVQNAIANIDTYGTDSGSANAYVITTSTVPWTTYAEPRVITFKALNGNTGASTININGIGAVGLKRFNGQALQSGDVLAGHWYTASYNVTTNVFEITSPGQSTSAGTITYAAPTGKATLAASLGVLSTVIPSDSNIAIDTTIAPTWSGLHTFGAGITVSAGNLSVSAGTISGTNLSSAGGANPTASVGLAAVNGTATTYLRSDGAPALSQAIAPTWTGNHTFAPSANGTAITVTSHNGATTANPDVTINRAGSTINVYQEGPNLTLNDTTNAKTAAIQVSGGQLEVYQNGTQVAFWNTNRGLNINAPASGVPLTITGNSSGAITANLGSNSGFGIITTAAATFFAGISMQGNGLAAGSAFNVFQNTNGDAIVGNNFSTGALNLQTNGANRIAIASTGVVTITSSSGIPLNVTGNNANAATVITSGNGAAQQTSDLIVQRAGSTVNSVGAGPSLQLFDTTNNTGSEFQHSGGQTECWQFNGSWKQIWFIQTNGLFSMGTSTTSSPGISIFYGSSGNGLVLASKTSASTAVQFNAGASGITSVGSISVTNTATAFNTSSDVRLKKNIVDAPDAGTVIDRIQVRSFDWRHTDEHKEFGFVAQELVEAVPDAVTAGDVWAVDYSKLVPLLVKEIQSLRRRMAALDHATR